jgi:hypothetical protein
MKTIPKLQPVFVAAAATSTGRAYPVEDFDKIIFQLGTASSANFTLKFQASYSDTCPDFSAPATATNHWDYIDTVDLLNKTSADGATGFSSAGTDVFKNIEVNCDAVRWICATITARAAGTINLGLWGTALNL